MKFSKKEEDVTSLIEKYLIARILKITDGNKIQAAALLGINRNTLHSKIKKYKIKKNIEMYI